MTMMEPVKWASRTSRAQQKEMLVINYVCTITESVCPFVLHTHVFVCTFFLFFALPKGKDLLPNSPDVCVAMVAVDTVCKGECWCVQEGCV